MTLGKRLRDTRKARHKTLRELSDEARVSWAYICQIENSYRTPSLKVLGRLAKALDTSVSYLLEGVMEESA